MYKSRQLGLYGLAVVLSAIMLWAVTAYGYDGDVDYAAPYITLDPETGKLVTVDPAKEQATVQPHSSMPAGPASEPDNNTMAAAISSTLPADMETQTAAAPVIIAIALMVTIGLVVTILRHKSGR